MKKLLVAFSLLIIDMGLVVCLGLLGLQEVFSMGVYLFPALLNAFLCKRLVKSRKSKDCAIVLLLTASMTLVVCMAISFWFYYTGQNVSSIIVLCTFVFIFFFAPNLAAAGLYGIHSHRAKVG